MTLLEINEKLKKLNEIEGMQHFAISISVEGFSEDFLGYDSYRKNFSHEIKDDKAILRMIRNKLEAQKALIEKEIKKLEG